MPQTLTPPATDSEQRSTTRATIGDLISGISRLEVMVAAAIALVLLVLVIVEPNILEAPFENERTLLFTVGGTAVAAAALVTMLRLQIPPAVRVAVLVVPFALVNWWLLSPYFVDDVVDEQFATSISAQLAQAPDDPAASVSAAVTTDSATGLESEPLQAPIAPTTDEPSQEAATAPTEPDDTPAAPAEAEAADSDVAEEEEAAAPPPPTGPVLLGAGRFVGLAGHDGTGDAGIFENPDGTLTLRFENFDIENGPDLEVYLVPGADQVSLPDGSIHLGALKGNIGAQNYDLPADTELAPGAYTVLIWCEAFSVEFVGATIDV